MKKITNTREFVLEYGMLTWESSYEIALRLIDAHPSVDIEQVGYQQLYEWIIALPDFADDPSLVNEGILKDILREWYEESGA